MGNALNVIDDAGLPQFEKFGRMISPSQNPTKTSGIVKRFSGQVGRRHNQEMRWVRETVARDDAFNLRGMGGAFAGLTAAQQLDAFMRELSRVQGQTVMEMPNGSPWSDPFVREAFVKGMLRGNKDLRALARGQRRERAKEIRKTAGNARNASATVYRFNQEGLFEAPTLDPDNIQDAIQAGERARLFELEAARTWQGLSGVTAQVNTQVAAVIANGLETRATPLQLAKDINDRIEKVGKTRSKMIARTETVAANNRGAVAEFAEAERLTGFDVLVQWETALDSRVRDTHIVRHGKVFTREEYLSLIGEPNCLLPDAMVFSPSPIVRAYKRSYEGKIVTLTTLDGHKITCTPNHPVLTPDGFKPAGEFKEMERNYILTTYDEGTDKIKDIYQSFSTRKSELDVLGTEPHHFHGDGQSGGTALVMTDARLATREHVMMKRDSTDTTLYGSVNQDHVVEVEWNDYFGHVYTLETVSGNFSAGGLISKNCRCSGLPYVPDTEGSEDSSEAKA